MNNIPFVENLLTRKILLYHKDTEDGTTIVELARRSVEKYENTLRLLRYKNHICFVSNINAVFQSFRCSNCDIFFKGNIQFAATSNGTYIQFKFSL